MGPKWLEALSKAVTYAGSGMTALTGTLQAAQQQEQIDAAWTALLNSPNAAIVAEAPAGLRGMPMEALQDYLNQIGVSTPVPGTGDGKQTAPLSVSLQASLAQWTESTAPSGGGNGGTPLEQAEKPWEIDPPAATLYGAVQDAGDGLTGGDIAQTQEKAMKLDEAVHGGPLYGERGDSPPGEAAGGRQLALPQTDDGMPPKMLSGSPGDHFQGTYTLKPNQTYTAHGATYHTDSNGAIRFWSATLSGSRQAAQRSPSHQRHLPGKLEGDHAGHYLAASEGGSGLADNLAPMDAKVNTRDYRAFERENRKLLEEGYTVQLEGSSHMGSSALRPDGIMVTRNVYDSDGNLQDREHFSWTNTDMSQYQDNDFGERDIPNAMDESLEKAGITREEIGALEEGEDGEKPAKTEKQQAESADRDQAGENQGEQAAPTDDQTEKAGEQPNQEEVSENEHGQPESRAEKAPEESDEMPRQEPDAVRETPQPDRQPSGKGQTEPSPSSGQAEKKAGAEEPDRKTSENDRKQPEDCQEAAHTSPEDVQGKKTEQEQTGSQEADNGRAPQPWEKDNGKEVEKPNQADEPHEPWKRNESAQDPGTAKSEADRDNRQPDGAGQTPWKKESGQGEETDRGSQEPTHSQTEKPDTSPAKEDKPKEKEPDREPWRRDDSSADKAPDKPRQEEPQREEPKRDAPKDESKDTPKQEPSSQNDGPAKNNDGGYHY